MSSTETRESLREKILLTKPKSKIIEFHNLQVEVRQPTLKATMKMASAKDGEEQSMLAAQLMVQFMFVPGTDDRIFNEEDTEALMDLPFGPDMIRFQDAVDELSGASKKQIDATRKNSEEGQGDSTS